MIGFIYIVRNTVNNKVYIGQTRTSVSQRWHEHVRHSKYCDYVINKAIRKYGADKFYVEVLETCKVEDLDEREIYYINQFDSTNKSKGYNVSLGGNTPKYAEKELDVAEMARLYQKELYSLQDIAELFETSIWRVRRDLIKAGVKIRDRHESTKRWNRVSPESLKEALRNTSSLRKAAKYLGMTYSGFRTACINNRIEYNSSTSARQ